MKETKTLPKKYSFSLTKAEQTGIRLAQITDKNTDVKASFAEFNKNFDVHSVIAWAGARTSRSADPYEDIFSEIHEATKDTKYTAGEKLAKVFVNYGHASVADMSPVMLYLNFIPMHLAFWLFNHTSVGGGQELSTRYVSLDNLGIDSLDSFLTKKASKSQNDSWQEIQDIAKENYEKWYPLIYDTLKEYIKENTDKKISKATLKARTLDIVRMFIPFGAKTSMTLLSSTRNWIDLVKQLRATEINSYVSLGDQINTLLGISQFEEGADIKADLAGLTKYSEGTPTVQDNLSELLEFLKETKLYGRFEEKSKRAVKKSSRVASVIEYIDLNELSSGSSLVLQYISLLYPSISESYILAEIDKLDDDSKIRIGEIILKTHMHHNLMRNAGDVRGSVFVLETAAAYQRDLNRHRATGRLIHMFESKRYDDIVYAGFNENYQLRETKALKGLKADFEKDMEKYYSKMIDLYEDIKKSHSDKDAFNAIREILPLGHQVKMHISAPAIQWNYLSSLRIALGGDFGYRDVVYQMLEELRSDPYFRNLHAHLEKPDPNSISELLGRS